jgi:ATP-dependent DNA helicase RecG
LIVSRKHFAARGILPPGHLVLSVSIQKPQAVSESNVIKTKMLQELADALKIPNAQVTAQAVKVLKAAVSEVKTREKLQSAADTAHREHFRKFYIETMVEAGWLERTIPDKPTNPPAQKYRLSDKGRAWLAAAKP